MITNTELADCYTTGITDSLFVANTNQLTINIQFLHSVHNNPAKSWEVEMLKWKLDISLQYHQQCIAIVSIMPLCQFIVSCHKLQT